jgi:AcrR family transcriptional regulator
VAEAKRAARGRKRAGSKRGGSRGPLPRAERRLQILDAARDVFAKRGYARATVDDIVVEAGVARGTFYLYFDDKRQAFGELVDRFADQITGVIQRIVTDDPERPISEQVLENTRAILRLCLSERSMTKILFTDAVGVDPEFELKLATFYDAVVQLLTESLREGQSLGIVADGEPRVLAYLTLGALKELLYQAVTLGLTEESAEAITQQIYSFLRQGYLRTDGPEVVTSRHRGARRARGIGAKKS